MKCKKCGREISEAKLVKVEEGMLVLKCQCGEITKCYMGC